MKHPFTLPDFPHSNLNWRLPSGRANQKHCEHTNEKYGVNVMPVTFGQCAHAQTGIQYSQPYQGLIQLKRLKVKYEDAKAFEKKGRLIVGRLSSIT